MLKPPHCDKCKGSGWLEVPDPAAKRIYKNHSATALLRCECRRGAEFQKHEKRLQPWKPATVKAPQKRLPQ